MALHMPPEKLFQHIVSDRIYPPVVALQICRGRYSSIYIFLGVFLGFFEGILKA